MKTLFLWIVYVLSAGLVLKFHFHSLSICSMLNVQVNICHKLQLDLSISFIIHWRFWERPLKNIMC